MMPDQDLDNNESGSKRQKAKRNSQIEQTLQQNSNQYYTMGNTSNSYAGQMDNQRKNQFSNPKGLPSENTENYYNNFMSYGHFHQTPHGNPAFGRQGSGQEDGGGLKQRVNSGDSKPSREFNSRGSDLDQNRSGQR